MGPAPAADERRTLQHDGVERVLTVLAPAGPASALVLVLHGSDSDAPAFRELSGHTFDRLRDRGAVVAYPEAWGGRWNDARLGTAGPARERDLDDVGFLVAVAAALSEEHAVPVGRTHAVGFSNGGQMVLRLVMQVPELLAGAAVVASNHPTEDNLLPEMASLDRHRPVPVLLLSGTDDPIVPFGGGEASLWGRASRGSVLSAREGAELLAARNGITAAPSHEQLTSGRWPATVARWRQEGRCPVDQVVVTGGGHTVPNRQRHAPLVMGRTARDLETGELVADFLGLDPAGGAPA